MAGRQSSRWTEIVETRLEKSGFVGSRDVFGSIKSQRESRGHTCTSGQLHDPCMTPLLSTKRSVLQPGTRVHRSPPPRAQVKHTWYSWASIVSCRLTEYPSKAQAPFSYANPGASPWGHLSSSPQLFLLCRCLSCAPRPTGPFAWRCSHGRRWSRQRPS